MKRIGSRVATLFAIGLFGCAQTESAPASPGLGMNESSVRACWGSPDAISEQAGDMERLLRSESEPRPKWRVQRVSWYYMSPDRVVVFEGGEVTALGPIDPERRETLDRVLPARQGDGDSANEVRRGGSP